MDAIDRLPSTFSIQKPTNHHFLRVNTNNNSQYYEKAELINQIESLMLKNQVLEEQKISH
jgi:hypothetical protein